MTSFRLTKIVEDDRGVSAFEDAEIPLSDAGPIGSLSELMGAEGVILRVSPGPFEHDWHPAPARQYIVLLDGEIEIEVGTGERRRFEGGDVVLAEDTTGRGHRTVTLSDGPRRSLFVPLGR